MRFAVEGVEFRDSGLPAFWLQFLPMREVSEHWPCSLLLVEVLFWDIPGNTLRTRGISQGHIAGVYSGMEKKMASIIMMENQMEGKMEHEMQAAVDF